MLFNECSAVSFSALFSRANYAFLTSIICMVIRDDVFRAAETSYQFASDKSLNRFLKSANFKFQLKDDRLFIFFRRHNHRSTPPCYRFLSVSRTNAQTFNSNKWIKIEAQHFVESRANTKKHKFYPRTRASIIIVVIASLDIIVWVSNIYFIFFRQFIVSAICICAWKILSTYYL